MENERRETVQDKIRHTQLANLLRLKEMPLRWGHDAENGKQNQYELKTTTINSFGTARDFNLDMIRAWRQRYWIFAKGINYSSGFKFEEIYFLSPNMLDEWFVLWEKKFEKDIRIRDIALSKLSNSLDESQLNRLKYLINRGMTYNNPKIGMGYIRSHGVRLDKTRCAEELKKLVAKNPL